jgi:hypothetical protein
MTFCTVLTLNLSGVQLVFTPEIRCHQAAEWLQAGMTGLNRVGWWLGLPKGISRRIC